MWTAFGLPGSPPERVGVGAAQPSPYAPHSRRVGYLLLGFLAVAALIQLAFLLFAQQRLVLDATWEYHPRVVATGSVQSEPFTLTGRTSNLVVEVSSSLAQSWAYFTLTLVNEDTGASRTFGRELAYYYGTDSDGRWTEGTPWDRVWLPAVPAGRYFLAGGAGEPARRSTTAVRLTRDVPRALLDVAGDGPAGGAAAVLLVAPVELRAPAVAGERPPDGRANRGGRRVITTYSVFAGCVLAALTWVQLTGWSPFGISEDKGVPKSVRDNPGSARPAYGGAALHGGEMMPIPEIHWVQMVAALIYAAIGLVLFGVAFVARRPAHALQPLAGDHRPAERRAGHRGRRGRPRHLDHRLRRDPLSRADGAGHVVRDLRDRRHRRHRRARLRADRGGRSPATCSATRVTQFSTVIGAYLFAMGIGAWLSRYLRAGASPRASWRSSSRSAWWAAGRPRCCSSPSATPRTSGSSSTGWSSLVGTLVGLEIPLLLRILKRPPRLQGPGRAGAVARLPRRAGRLAAVPAAAGAAARPGPHLAAVRPRSTRRSGLWTTWIFRRELAAPGLPARVRRSRPCSAWRPGRSRRDRITAWSEDRLYADDIVLARTSPYQRIVLTRAGDDLRLFLNGNLQFASRDEYRYHEALVHPALAAPPAPRARARARRRRRARRARGARATRRSSASRWSTSTPR